MITVADILALPAFQKVEPISTPQGSYGRSVVNIGVVDATPDEDGYSDYLPGEFIVTNLGFVRDDVVESEKAVCTILERNLAALAIRNVYDLPMTDAMRTASERSGTPLFLYEGGYYEQVIFQAMKFLERDRQDSDISAFVDTMVSRRSAEAVRSMIYEAIGATGSTIQCAQIRPASSDEVSLYAQIDELHHVTAAIEHTWKRIETANAFRYHDRILLIVTYTRPPEAFSLHYDSEFMDLLKPYGTMLCGISEEVALGQGDIAIRQAKAALAEAIATGRPIVRWAALLDRAFSVAAESDRMLFDTCRLYQEILERYDGEHDASMAETARALAEACGDINAAAASLFQHPNTIRYRMRKLKTLFNMGSASDRELVRFLILTYLV